MLRQLVELGKKVSHKIMGKQDLKPIEVETLKNLEWNADKAGDLQKVKEYVSSKAREAANWYYAAKRGKKWAACFFRVGIILLTAAAGILPLLNEVHQSQQTDKQLKQIWRQQTEASLPTVNPTNPPPALSPPAPLMSRRLFDPAWSAILLAIAGTLLALDRFHGATSGWVRYVLAAQQLTEALDEFELAFETQKPGWSNGQPTVEEARTALGLAQNFMRQANGIVHEETKVWAEEFGIVLKELDEKLRVATASQQKAEMQITVTNGDQSPKGWKLTVGGLPPEDRTGKEASLKVAPGLYVVRVAGELNGKPAKDEKSVTVAPGGIQKVELTLA